MAATIDDLKQVLDQILATMQANQSANRYGANLPRPSRAGGIPNYFAGLGNLGKSNLGTAFNATAGLIRGSLGGLSTAQNAAIPQGIGTQIPTANKLNLGARGSMWNYMLHQSNIAGNIPTASPVANLPVAQAIGGAASAAGAAGAGGGGAAAGVGGALAAAGPIGMAVAATVAVVALGVELAKLPGQIKDWANSLLESQRKLGEVSGAMAQVFARKDVFDTFRNQRIGDATAGSAGNLEGSYEHLSNALESIDTLTSNIWNDGVAIITELFADLMDIMNVVVVPVLKAIGEWLKLIYESVKRDSANEDDRPLEDFAYHWYARPTALDRYPLDRNSRPGTPSGRGKRPPRRQPYGVPLG